MKPEPLPKFIARMKGREFTAGDVGTWCQIPAGEVANRLAPYREMGWVKTEEKKITGGITTWRAIGTGQA